MFRLSYILFIGLLISSCSMNPEAINYGEDQCHYCKMTVVDQTHAAQYVTSKGKQFKFDAIECMVNELNDNPTKEIAASLVSDFQSPGTMTEAQEATYLISKAIKSPMGAFLTAFASAETANKTQQESGGKLYTWDELKQHFSEN